MKLVRVSSIFRKGLNEFKDFKIVICCGLDSNEKVLHGAWPGVFIEEKSKTPFLLKAGKKSMLCLSDDRDYETTFGEHEIRPAELFTVGPDWIYQVSSCHQYVNPTENTNENSVKKVVKMSAVCVNSRHLTKSSLFLWCGLDARGDLVSGDWMGYRDDDGSIKPLVVSVGRYSTVDYGENFRKPTSLKSGKVGDIFTVSSTNDHGDPDIYTYEIKKCTAL